MHLEKLKAKRLAVKNKEQLNHEAIKSELDALDRERRWIEFQMKQRREAEKWEEEFAKKKDEHVASSEYPTEDYESSFRGSAYSERSRREDSVGSYSSFRRKKKASADDWSEHEELKEDCSSKGHSSKVVKL